MSRHKLPVLSATASVSSSVSVAGVEIDRWNKLSGAVASGSFVGRLTTGRVDDAARKMTRQSGVGRGKGYITWYTGLPVHAACSGDCSTSI